MNKRELISVGSLISWAIIVLAAFIFLPSFASSSWIEEYPVLSFLALLIFCVLIGVTSIAAAVSSKESSSMEQKLTEMKLLKEKNLITDEEYSSVKAKILDNT